MALVNIVVCANPLLATEVKRWDGVDIGHRTIATVVSEFGAWGVGDVNVAVAGRKLDPSEYDAIPEDGTTILISPRAGIEFVGQLIVNILVSALISYLYYVIVGVPGLGDDALSRDDEESPTYSFNQIQTEYRPGFPVPMVFGRHDVGGQVVSIAIYLRTVPELQERVAVLLVFSEGRIHSIGGVTGNDVGEANNLGGIEEINPATSAAYPAGPAIPSDFRVNGSRFDATQTYPGAAFWLRMGTLDQSVFPAAYHDQRAFGSASRVLATGFDLVDVGDEGVFSISDPEPISGVTAIISFPLGLYTQVGDGTRDFALAEFAAEFRQVDSPGFIPIATISVFDIISQGFSIAFEIPFGSAGPVPGPIEIKIKRLNPQGGADEISRARWRNVQWERDGSRFRYPRCAMAGVLTDVFEGGRPTFIGRIEGLLVRVWDSAIGGGEPSSDRYWSASDVGPYVGIWTYDPGRNPAWIAAEFVSHPAGLGEFIRDDQIDWPAFRNWADFCDRDALVDGVAEAFARFNGVLDTSRSAWDFLLSICQVGRAAPIWDGNKLTVAYQYRDSHGRGTNSVPAKTPVQLVATANVTDFSITYLNTQNRPAVIGAQILDEANDFVITTVEVEDPAGFHFRPDELHPIGLQKQTVRLFGVTSISQCRRELLFRHAVNRLVRSSVQFRIGIEALAVTVGDLIYIEHDVIRAFDPKPESFVVQSTGTGISFTADRDLVMPASGNIVVEIQQSDQAIKNLNVLNTNGTTVLKGDTIVVDESFEFSDGMTGVIGLQDLVVKTYEIARVSLRSDLTKEVTALEWAPGIHDMLDVGETETMPEGMEGFVSSFLDEDFTPNQAALIPTSARLAIATPSVDDLFVRRERGGRHIVGWNVDASMGIVGTLVRVREVGEISWRLVARTTENVAAVELRPLRRYEVAVSARYTNGATQTIVASPKLEFLADEFEFAVPIAPQYVSATQHANGLGLSLSWPSTPLASAYEVVVGSSPLAPVSIRRTTENQVDIPYVIPPTGELPVGVRTLYASGLRSEIRAVDVSGLGDPAGPTLDTSLTGGSIASGEASATIESSSVSTGYDVDTMVAVTWDADASDGDLVGDEDFVLGSGEAAWQFVGGREASPARPGLDLDVTVGDLTGTIGELTNNDLVAGKRGESGVAHAVRCEIRTARLSESISSKPWRPYSGPTMVPSLESVQVRFVLARADIRSTVTLSSPRLRRIYV